MKTVLSDIKEWNYLNQKGKWTEVRLGRAAHGGGLMKLADSNMEVHYTILFLGMFKTPHNKIKLKKNLVDKSPA